MKTTNSEALFARGQKVVPGGVNSPVRAFRGVGGTPRFIERGEGSRLIDVDGNSYIDYICSWGPLIFGHRPGFLVEAVRANWAASAANHAEQDQADHAEPLART